MKKLILLLAASMGVMAQQTNILDTLYYPGPGAPPAKFNGSLDISWITFTACDGSVIPTGHQNFQVKNGAINIWLQKYVASSCGVIYTVRYALTNGLQQTEYWNVPASGPTNLAGVRVPPQPPPPVPYIQSINSLTASGQFLTPTNDTNVTLTISEGGGNTHNFTMGWAGTLAVARGGNGTATPTLTAGTGISLSGSWPNYTITNTGVLPAIPVPVTSGGTGTTTQFTACSVVFAGASGVYSQDNSNLCYKSATHDLLVGGSTEGNYRLDLQSSGSSGTVRFYDQTPSTGNTTVWMRAGAGQNMSGENLLSFQNNGGAINGGVGPNGETYITDNANHFMAEFNLGYGISLNNAGLIGWSSSNQAFQTPFDIGLGRNQAGQIEVNDGTTPGTYRDLIDRTTTSSALHVIGSSTGYNAILSGLTGSSSYNVTIPAITGNDNFCLVTLANCGSGGYSSLTQDGTTGQLTASKGLNGPVATGGSGATPTIDLALCNRCEMPTLTANVTAVTFTHKKNGASFDVVWPQATSGGPYTVSYGSATNVCQVNQIVSGTSIVTTQHFEIDSSGNILGQGCQSTGPGWIGLVPAAFSTYPPCSAAYEGFEAAITDSMTNTWGATITGSGSDHVLGFCDGTNWTVTGK